MAAALPMFFIKKQSTKVEFINVFSSGTILGLCFVHILPEAVEKVIHICGSKLSQLMTVFAGCWVLWRFIEDITYSLGYRRHKELYNEYGRSSFSGSINSLTKNACIEMEVSITGKEHSHERKHDHDHGGCSRDHKHDHEQDQLVSSCAGVPDEPAKEENIAHAHAKGKTGKTLYLSILATSVHCFVEGALVVISSAKWISMVAILLHKLIVAFSFGYKVAMVQNSKGRICKTGLVTLGVFLLSTPLSIVIVTITKANWHNNSGLAVMDWLKST